MIFLQAIRPCCESETGWTWEATLSDETIALKKVNEHSLALKVFWSRHRRDGRRQVKGSSAAPPTNALDHSAARGYSEGAYKRAGGVWPLRPPFRFNFDELPSLATLR